MNLWRDLDEVNRGRIKENRVTRNALRLTSDISISYWLTYVLCFTTQMRFCSPLA